MFKAEHLDEDGYLKYIYSYIHLNPVKLIQSDWKEKGLDDIEKTKEFLNNYKYSSYCDYLNLNRRETKILNKKVFPEYFESVDIFTDEIFSWLKFSK
jgi:putative transposase